MCISFWTHRISLARVGVPAVISTLYLSMNSIASVVALQPGTHPNFLVVTAPMKWLSPIDREFSFCPCWLWPNVGRSTCIAWFHATVHVSSCTKQVDILSPVTWLAGGAGWRGSCVWGQRLVLNRVWQQERWANAPRWARAITSDGYMRRSCGEVQSNVCAWATSSERPCSQTACFISLWVHRLWLHRLSLAPAHVGVSPYVWLRAPVPRFLVVPVAFYLYTSTVRSGLLACMQHCALQSKLSGGGFDPKWEEALASAGSTPLCMCPLCFVFLNTFLSVSCLAACSCTKQRGILRAWDRRWVRNQI